MRRTRRNRAFLALFVFAVTIVFLLLTLARVAHPFTLSRLAHPFDETHLLSNAPFNSSVALPGESLNSISDLNPPAFVPHSHSQPSQQDSDNSSNSLMSRHTLDARLALQHPDSENHVEPDDKASTEHAQPIAVADNPVHDKPVPHPVSADVTADQPDHQSDENAPSLEDTSASSKLGAPAVKEEREKYGAAKMSIVVLFHNEYDSMKTALNSWIEKGLIDYVDEILFFLNGVPSEAAFTEGIPDYASRIPEPKRRLYVSKENLPLGLAITKMVEMASHEYILLLEKDWELIEPQEVMRSRLVDSKVIVGSGVAHLVRHRHRHNPGVPLHALIMHQGREESIIRQQKNLLCYVHHWQKDPPNMFPGNGIMRRCGGPQNNVDEEDVYCSSSEYCQWTNNPGVFKKQWFMDEIGHEYRKQYEIELKQHGKSSPFLDFEYYTNWRSYAWSDKNFTVAVGTGLFRHAETEHQHFNTVWYAHYRLSTDLEEIRNTYLRNETAFKRKGGVHYDPRWPKPPPMIERYPVDFVRKFQFKDMFTGTLDTQKNMINEAYSQYLQKYRILTNEEWQKTGPSSEKAKRRVDWRVHITRMHHIVEKAMMIAPPQQPHEMSITLVTCLLDIGRNELDDDGYQFRREFKMYIDAMADWLTHTYPKVVYTSKKIADELFKTMSEETKASTKFVYVTREELSSKWLGPDNYARVQEIRNSEQWTARASWLKNSPQAALKDYNPLVMSKMFMMRDAARRNHWNTSHFVFVDAKHNCRQPKIMNAKNDHILRAHMFDRFLLTTFDYTPSTEVHGFEYTDFNRFCNKPNPSQRQVVRVGRGGIFGGSAFVLEYITAMYDVALTATLREGLMGTEENILSILKYQVPQYVDEFSNNWACPSKIEKDHACPDKNPQGYNCAIFEWVARDAVRPEGAQ